MELLEKLNVLNNEYNLHTSEARRHFASANKVLIERKKLIYEWVAKRHPSWLKNSTVKYDLDNGNDTDYDGISLKILNEGKTVWLSIEFYIPNLPPEVEHDTYWATHEIKLEDLNK